MYTFIICSSINYIFFWNKSHYEIIKNIIILLEIFYYILY